MSEAPEAPLDHYPASTVQKVEAPEWLQAECFAPKYLVCLRQVGPCSTQFLTAQALTITSGGLLFIPSTEMVAVDTRLAGSFRQICEKSLAEDKPMWPGLGSSVVGGHRK